jgi:chaperonin GroEL (HSP60 family)
VTVCEHCWDWWRRRRDPKSREDDHRSRVTRLVLAKLNADNDDQRFGIEIVCKAVLAPLRQIAENAGEDGAVIAGKILDRDEYNWGFDA